MNKQIGIKVIWSMLFVAELLLGMDVPIDEVEKQYFQDEISVNSKIVQLSTSKEEVMARMGGKISKYLVKQGQKVKKGQAIAKIESLELSKLFSELKLQRKQLVVHNKNYKIVKKLYNSGLESLQNLNTEQRKKDEIVSKIESIKAQLALMGVSSKGATKSSYTVYAQGSGTVAKILIPSNAVVDANRPLVSIVKGESSFLAKAYVSLKYVNEIAVGQKAKLFYGNKNYAMHVTQILPELDEKTQQMVILLSLDEPVPNLFVNAYVETKLFIGVPKVHLAVKKSALSFFNNEWVVFTPKHHEEHEEEHKEEKHDEHEGHDEHEEEEVPYAITVVKILKQNENWVAIEGMDEHADYVSAKSYYIKSLLLKSSLGGHGH